LRLRDRVKSAAKDAASSENSSNLSYLTVRLFSYSLTRQSFAKAKEKLFYMEGEKPNAQT